MKFRRMDYRVFHSMGEGKKKKLKSIELFRLRSHLFFPEGNIQTCHDLQRNQILDWKIL